MSMDGIHYVGTMEFVKKDDLDKAIETIGESKVKKYIFGVNE